MSQTPPDESHYHHIQYSNIPRDIEAQINDITNLQNILNHRIQHLQDQLQYLNQRPSPTQVQSQQQSQQQPPPPHQQLIPQPQLLPQPQQLPSPPHQQSQEKIKLPPITELPLYKQQPITPPQTYQLPPPPAKKKRKQNTINFMISTPSNPPLKKKQTS
ncbi:hypothetical protein SBY92_004047 [Candida maltosa Xu316]